MTVNPITLPRDRNFESDNKRNWWRYGFGFLVPFIMLAAGIYFWFPTSHFVEKAETVPVEIKQQPVFQGGSQAGSAPVVTQEMPEKSKNEINAQEPEKAKEIPKPAETASVKKIENRFPKKVFDQVAASGDVVSKKTKSAQTAPMEPKKIILELRSNSLKLTKAGQSEFDEFVRKLKLYPRATVLVKGFVSAQSNSPENIKLSRDRAMSVQKLLVEKGIGKKQIEIVGMGNLEPIAPNNSREGRKKNRRVEIVVISDGTKETGGD